MSGNSEDVLYSVSLLEKKKNKADTITTGKNDSAKKSFKNVTKEFSVHV